MTVRFVKTPFHLLSKTSICLFLLLLLSRGTLLARINLLEPWTQGVDASVPEKDWTHGGNLRIAHDSTDLIELDYLLSRSLSKSLELGGSLGLLSTNPDGGDGHSGINDLTIAGKYRRPMGAESVSTTWIGEAGLSLPTGDSDNGLGAGGIGLLMGWGLETPIQLVTGYAHLGVRLYTEGNDTQFGNVFSYTLGARYEMDPRWNLTCDLRGFNRGKDKINKVRQPEGVQELYLAPGTEWSPEQFPAVLSGTLLLGLSRDAYNWGLVAGIKF